MGETLEDVANTSRGDIRRLTALPRQNQKRERSSGWRQSGACLGSAPRGPLDRGPRGRRKRVARKAATHGGRSGRAPPSRIALHLLLVLVAFGLDLHGARSVPELPLPLLAPAGPDAILALDLPLELPALGLELHLARPIPELLLPLAPPPA